MSDRRHKFWRVVLPIVIGLMLLIFFWNWNWFRPLVEHEASSALGREITLAHFDIQPSFTPLLIADGIEIANPPEFPHDSRFGSVQRLAIRIDFLSLLHGHLVLPEILIDHPEGDLQPSPSGVPNWRFRGASPPKKTQASEFPEIGEVKIVNGIIHIDDPALKSNFSLRIETLPAARTEKASIVVDIKGTYGGEPVVGRLVGGSILTLRSADHPYPVDLKLANGATRIALVGTIQRPLAFGGANLDLDLRGDDLANLYHLTSIPFAPTPPFHLEGHLDYSRSKIRFRDFHGTVGSSDLSGELDVEPEKGRPNVTGTLTSQQVVLSDLGGFIGAVPGSSQTPNQTAQQKEAHQTQAANPNLLPDTPINLPKIRAANINVSYYGKKIVGSRGPLDDLMANLTIEDGRISLNPLSFGIGQGQIRAQISLDGTREPVHTIAVVDFRKIDLHRLLQTTKVFQGEGIIGGRATLDTNGDSLAKMMAHGNGGLDLFMSGPGNMSALLVDLSGLEFGNSLLSAIGLPDQTDVRCIVVDGELDTGLLRTKTMLVDTTTGNIVGKGSIDFRNQTIDYKITTTPKHFSIGSLPAPIDLNGPLKRPAILPDPAAVAMRGGAAAALGIFLTPLAALIPTIQLGLGNDNDCKTLIGMAQREAKATRYRTGVGSP